MENWPFPVVPHKSSPSSNPQARDCGMRSVLPSRPRLRTFLPTDVSDAQEASLWWELHPPSKRISTALDYISQGASRSRLLSVERSLGLLVLVPTEGYQFVEEELRGVLSWNLGSRRGLELVDALPQIWGNVKPMVSAEQRDKVQDQGLWFETSGLLKVCPGSGLHSQCPPYRRQHSARTLAGSGP